MSPPFHTVKMAFKERNMESAYGTEDSTCEFQGKSKVHVHIHTTAHVVGEQPVGVGSLLPQGNFQGLM